MKRLLDRSSILTRDSWKFYKERCGKANRTSKVNRDNHSNVLSRFFEIASDRLLENKSGVYLKDLGYFCIMMYPKRMMLRSRYDKNGGKHLNLHTDHRVYSPQWIHRMENFGGYSTWTMDRTFSESTIRRPLAEKLRSGKKYSMELTLIESLKKAK